MKPFSLLATLALSACGVSEPYYFTTARGARVHIETGVTVKVGSLEFALNKQERDLIDLINREQGPDEALTAVRCIEGEEVILKDVAHCTGGPVENLAGCYDGFEGEVQIELQWGSVWMTPYAHELYHMIQWCGHQRVDTHHKDPLYAKLTEMRKADYMAHQKEEE